MWGEGMLDLLVPLRGGFVFSVPHCVVLVRGVVQAAGLLNSQKCKCPSALWPPLRPFLCPCSKSLSTQQLPSKSSHAPRSTDLSGGLFALWFNPHFWALTCHHPGSPLLTGAPAVGLFSLCLVLLPRPSPSGLSSQGTWKIPSMPNSSLLTL